MTVRFENASRWVLAVGFLSVAVAVITAHTAPANGYELSLYRATPLVTWAGVAVAVTTALAVFAYAEDARDLGLAAVLVGMAVVTVAGLPLIRGYHFYGLSDALNHLGFARKVAAGHRSFFSYIYPGPQTFAVILARVTGWGIPRAMLFATVVYVVVYLLFVPLIVAKIATSRVAVLVGVVAAGLLMPINNIATTLQFHNFTLATLFVPLGFYLFVSHVTGDTRDDRLPGPLSPAATLMPLVGAAVILFHPLAAFDFLLVLAATAFVQAVVRWRRPSHPFGRTRLVVGQAVVLAVLWFTWSQGHWGFGATAERTIDAAAGMLSGASEAGSGVESRAESAQALQIPIVSLFVRLLLVEAVAGAICLALFVWQWSGWASETADHTPSVSYFAVGGIALLPVMIVQFHGDVSHLFFRHVGFGYVFVSVLLGVALGRLRGGLDRRLLAHPVVRPVAVSVGVLAVALSLAALFHSPFIYQFNHHVPESQMSGFEAAFEQQPSGGVVWFSTYRVGSRYKTALASKPGTSWHPDIVRPPPRFTFTVPPGESTDVRRYFETHPEQVVRRDHYLHVSTVQTAREVELYEGQRYAQSEFDSLAAQEGVHRIRTGGVSTWYYVDLDSPEAGPVGTNISADQSEGETRLRDDSVSVAGSAVGHDAGSGQGSPVGGALAVGDPLTAGAPVGAPPRRVDRTPVEAERTTPRDRRASLARRTPVARG